MELAEQVATLLRDSMSLHIRSAPQSQGRDKDRRLLKVRDRDLMQQAHDKRAEAHALDPEHTAPAWAEERVKTNTAKDTHTALMAFYREQGIS